MNDKQSRPPVAKPSGGAGGTYGQDDISKSSQRSRQRTEKPNEVAAGKVAENGGATEGGAALSGPDAGGDSDEDLGRGGD
jgi:hypothetical protein